MVGITGEVERRVQAALKPFIDRGEHPGDFWYSVLSNNLIGTYAHADEQNFKDLTQIIVYVTNSIPLGAWGSEDAVKNWMSRGGLLHFAEPEIV